MRRANKVKIAPNLVSVARSKHDTANVNEATRSEESALIATFPQLEPVNIVIPIEVLEITPLDKENVLTVVSDDLSRDSAEKLKSDKKQTDATKPLLLKKAITKGKLAIEEVDRSRLTIKQLMYINPADGVKP
jgi:transcription factor TFIIIB component B''